MNFTIYDGKGRRKYLTRSETRMFLSEAERRDPLVQSFCWTIALTGCRISEALSFTAENFDFDSKQVVIESLKKRRKQVFRAVPLPYSLLNKLQQFFDNDILSSHGRLWPWSRMTGYRRIREVMDDAHISGDYASPKGLRHGFAVQAIQSQVPLNLVQRWLGHADIKTTSIYTAAMGPEERAIASQMWREMLGKGGTANPADMLPRQRLRTPPREVRSVSGQTRFI